MPAISITDLNNAKLDVDHIAAVTTSPALTATDRLGNTKKTLAGALAALDAAVVTSAVGQAVAARTGAELARDIAFATANIKTSTAQGITDTNATANKYFAIISASASGSVDLYLNSAGTAVFQKTVGGAGAARDALYAAQQAALDISKFQTAGRAVDPVTGGASGASTYVMATPFAQSGALSKIRIFGMNTGTILVKLLTKVGNDFTQVGPDYPVSVVPGLQTLTARDFGYIPVAAGQLIGFYTGAPLVVPNTGSTADGAGWYSSAGNVTAFTSASLVTSARLQVGFEMQYTDTVTAKLASLINTADFVGPDVAGLNSAAGVKKTEAIGRPATPVTGSAAGSSTYVFASPALHDGFVKTARLFTVGAGTLKIRRFTKAGAVFTQIGEDTTLAVAVGLNTLALPTPKRVLKGECLGFYVGNVLAAPNGTADGAGWYFANGDVASVTGAAVTSIQLQLGFDLEYVALVNVVGTSATLRARGLAKYPLSLAAQSLHSLGYGQSNDVGANQTALTTTASLYHRTFNVGPKMTQPGLSGATNPDDGLTKFLVEDNAAPSASTFGETKASGFARGFSRRRAARGTPPVWFGSSAGKSGGPLVDIIPTGAWYANLIYHVTAAKAAAVAAGQTYAVPVILFDHGETDQQINTSLANCLARLTLLMDTANIDIQAITGQTEPVQFLFTTAIGYITTSANHTMALLSLAESRDDCHFVVPGYRFAQGGDAIHLTNWSQALKGEYYARAASQLAEGRIPDRVRWLGAYASGTALTVTASAPTALQLSTAIRPAATDSGFKVMDGTGTLTLSSIAAGAAVFNPQTGLYDSPITMTLNRALGASPVIRYALDFQGTGMLFTGGASGNVFDTTPEAITISGTAYSLAHPAPPVSLPVYVLE